MRGWVLIFKDGDVKKLAKGYVGGSDRSEVSILGDNWEAREGVSHPFHVASGANICRTGLEIVFSEAAEHAIVRPMVPKEEMKNGRESMSGLDVEGSIDSITERFASGWVWCRSASDQAVEVEALLNGTVIGHATADQMRPDLAESGKGTGRYGFNLSFLSPLEDETLPIFRVKGPEGSVVIPNNAKVRITVTAAKVNPSESQELVLPAVGGSIDRMTRREAEGWAWFPSEPEETAQVEAVLDGKVIGRAWANQLRPDLAQHGKGTGLYGFKIKFDEAVTGATAPEFRVLPAVGRLLANKNELPPVSPSDLIKRSSQSTSALLNEHAAFTTRGPLFEEFDESIIAQVTNSEDKRPKPLLVAFYLPQFHPIEENDYFWGKGFTEWRQLSKGMPRFPGHYQPRIPRDLGFYNLENLEELVKQVAMAKAGGVNGFAYYYYWFNRKRVLERPLELLLESDVDMPFMLIWANENWTRAWDGSESEVLLKQNYHPDDEEALMDDIARHFSDRRYIRVNGRPLFVIYNPQNVPDGAETFKRWRGKLTARIGVDPLLFMAQTFGELDPRPHSLDGALEFPPHKLSNYLPGRPSPDAYSSEFAGRVISYDDFAKASLDEDDSEAFPLIKTIVPSWDNDSRRPNRGLTLEGVAPQKYENWLTELITRAMDKPIFGTPIVAINAWNEWAESAYLEPDVYFGAAYLNATARAYVSAVNNRNASGLEGCAQGSEPPTVSVIFPNYNHEKFLRERLTSVLEQTVRPAEIIFLDDCSSDNSVKVAREILSESNIPFRIIENELNSGCVFRQWMKGIDLARHDLIWVAETDDAADLAFLAHVAPAFERQDVMAAFGRITCIDPEGQPRGDLDNYFDDLKIFSWQHSCVVSSVQAFSHDFTVKNIIPNASGLVFRKPILTEKEREQLFEYRFAGDWYFYSLVARGGAIAYCRKARSFFRVNPSSASRSSFFTERHLVEHKMIVQHLMREYGVKDAAINAHCHALARYLTDHSAESLSRSFRQGLPKYSEPLPIRICIAANGFSVGGGEILPVELANKLKGMGVHITYLVIERPNGVMDGQVRRRLRSDIPVVYWDSICDDLPGFISRYDIQLINSHNVSVDFRFFLRKIDLKIPYVASLHGGYETVPNLLTPEFLAYLSKNVTKWLYLAERNLAFLPAALREAKKILHSFNAVPPLGRDVVDRETFRAEHGIAADAFVLVLCSRAIASKGWREAIEIVQRIYAKNWLVHLVLIGDGPAATELKEQFGTSSLVTFLGQIESPNRFFKCFDMGIFPTRFEGETFPLFLLECFEAGLPVATTDIGEIPRIMEGVLTPGILADHRSDSATLVAEFVTKLEEMFMTAGACDAYAAGAVTTSRRFSMTVLGDLYLTSFRDLIEPKAKSKPIKTKRRDILRTLDASESPAGN